MVLASAKHPAMLVYLDNFQSIGPNSRRRSAAAAAAHARAQRELRARAAGAAHARRRRRLHAAGRAGAREDPDRLDGRRARRRTGAADGAAARPPAWPAPACATDRRSASRSRSCCTSRARKRCSACATPRPASTRASASFATLCRHPSTARFVATKLVTHFVARRAAGRRRRSHRARLPRQRRRSRAVSRGARSSCPRRGATGARKFRTPQDWLVAVLRAFDAAEVSATALPSLRQLRHPLWSPQAPKGFGDTMQEWADPDSLLNRAELARTHRAPAARRSAIDPRGLLDVVDVAAGDPLRALARGHLDCRRRARRARARRPAFQWR